MHDEGGADFEKVIEWEADPKTIVTLYYLNNWIWAPNGTPPTWEEFEKFVRGMIESLDDYGPGVYLTGGRLKVHKDPEFPESHEIYVHIGHVSPRIPKDSK